MPDPKQLLKKWIHRKGSSPPATSNPLSTHNLVDRAKSGNAAEAVLDNITLALSLAELAVDIAQAAPFIAPAAAFLTKIINSYKVNLVLAIDSS